jgi:tRNA1(Val) A37 N6-methylase TrmN6
LRELVRTNDAVLVSVIDSLLNAARIHHLIFDQNMSVLEGSLGVLPRRVLVADVDVPAARRLLEDAGLAHELRPDVKATAGLDITADAVLGGRLTLRQPKRGHRVGHDAILLAAATRACAGDLVVDLGAGVGAAGLAVARRVEGTRLILAEIDEALCELARENIRSNGFAERAHVLPIDVTASGAFDAEGVNPGSVQRILTNPPFLDAERSNVSPDSMRRLAHAASRETLPLWINTALRLLSLDGELTLIWRADALAEARAALSDFGEIAVLPIFPRADAEPIRAIVRARRSVQTSSITYAPLVLNDVDGKPTPEAEAVLRGGEPIRFAQD